MHECAHGYEWLCVHVCPCVHAHTCVSVRVQGADRRPMHVCARLRPVCREPRVSQQPRARTAACEQSTVRPAVAVPQPCFLPGEGEPRARPGRGRVFLLHGAPLLPDRARDPAASSPTHTHAHVHTHMHT